MTNAEIIFNASQALAKDGIIKYTGREIEAVDGEGNPTVIKETEPIHTYAAWKNLGFQVQKGQKAVASFKIWKHTSREKEDGKSDTKMFMTKAFFFTSEQVAPIQ